MGCRTLTSNPLTHTGHDRKSVHCGAWIGISEPKQKMLHISIKKYRQTDSNEIFNNENYRGRKPHQR